MWIIPSNHPLYLVFAKEYLASKEDLQGSEQTAELAWKDLLKKHFEK